MIVGKLFDSIGWRGEYLFFGILVGIRGFFDSFGMRGEMGDGR